MDLPLPTRFNSPSSISFLSAPSILLILSEGHCSQISCLLNRKPNYQFEIYYYSIKYTLTMFLSVSGGGIVVLTPLFDLVIVLLPQ